MTLFDWLAQIDEHHNFNNDVAYRYVRDLIENAEGVTRSVYDVVDAVVSD